jgi:cholesterol transport system auxiliary component
MNAAALDSYAPRGWRFVAAALSIALVCGCSTIREAVVPSAHPNYYSLAEAGSVPSPAAPRAAGAALTLIVNPPHAAAGFDSQRMMYVRHAGQLEYFAYNEWIDTPARMLAPLIVTAVEGSGAFRAVVQTPSPASGDLRLDTEVLRLQHEFLSTPSVVRFTLRAYLIESATRRVVASREFEATAASASEDPQGGVVAAAKAVKSVLAQLATFCAQTAAGGVARSTPGAVAR